MPVPITVLTSVANTLDAHNTSNRRCQIEPGLDIISLSLVPSCDGSATPHSAPRSRAGPLLEIAAQRQHRPILQRHTIIAAPDRSQPGDGVHVYDCRAMNPHKPA